MLIQEIKNVALFMAGLGGFLTLFLLLTPFLIPFGSWCANKYFGLIIKYTRWVNKIFSKEKSIMVNDVVLTGKAKEEFLNKHEG